MGTRWCFPPSLTYHQFSTELYNFNQHSSMALWLWLAYWHARSPSQCSNLCLHCFEELEYSDIQVLEKWSDILLARLKSSMDSVKKVSDLSASDPHSPSSNIQSTIQHPRFTLWCPLPLHSTLIACQSEDSIGCVDCIPLTTPAHCTAMQTGRVEYKLCKALVDK